MRNIFWLWGFRKASWRKWHLGLVLEDVDREMMCEKATEYTHEKANNSIQLQPARNVGEESKRQIRARS